MSIECDLEDGKKIVIEASGTCFSDVVDYINDQFLNTRSWDDFRSWADTIRIVHGIMTNTDGVDYSHAWIETLDDTVYHFGLIEGKFASCEIKRAEYEKGMRVKHKTYYTIKQLIEEQKKHGRPGPWIKEYYELCRDVRSKK